MFFESMLSPKLFFIKCQVSEKFTSISCPCQNIWEIIWKANHFRTNSIVKKKRKASSKNQVQTMWCKSIFFFWGWGGEAKLAGILWSFYQAPIFSAGAPVATGKRCDTTPRFTCNPRMPNFYNEILFYWETGWQGRFLLQDPEERYSPPKHVS